jgi:Pleckstrin homology domain
METKSGLCVHQNGMQSINQLSIRSQSLSSNRSRCASIASMQSGTSISSSAMKEPISATAYQSIANLITNTQLSATYTSDAPFYKEGVIIGKHLLEKADQKAKHREWKEYFCIVHRAELLIHRLEHRGNDRKSVHKGSYNNNVILSTYANVSGRKTSFAIGGGDLIVSDGRTG